MKIGINKKALIIAMASKCLNVRGLAREAKIGEATVNLILNHDRCPNLTTIGKIASALDVSPAELLAD